jgi:uncharacterized membrane protein
MVNLPTLSPRWLGGLLIASVALNIFFAGIFVGRMAADQAAPQASPIGLTSERQFPRGPRGPMGDMPGQFIIQRMAENLPPEDRPKFEAVVASHKATLASSASQVRDARLKVRDAMAGEPFDRAALDRAFEQLRRRNEDLQKAMQTALAEAVAELPPEARKKLADWRNRRARST